jgi:non-ribosomal peptide synthetase component F
MVLLAALYAALTRYTGQTDLVVGMPLDRRTPPLRGVVGRFANTVALRADTSGDPTVRELLARVRRVCAEASEHADLPFEQVQAAVGRPFRVLLAPGEPAHRPDVDRHARRVPLPR